MLDAGASLLGVGAADDDRLPSVPDAFDAGPDRGEGGVVLRLGDGPEVDDRRGAGAVAELGALPGSGVPVGLGGVQGCLPGCECSPRLRRVRVAQPQDLGRQEGDPAAGRALAADLVADDVAARGVVGGAGHDDLDVGVDRLEAARGAVGRAVAVDVRERLAAQFRPGERDLADDARADRGVGRGVVPESGDVVLRVGLVVLDDDHWDRGEVRRDRDDRAVRGCDGGPVGLVARERDAVGADDQGLEAGLVLEAAREVDLGAGLHQVASWRPTGWDESPPEVVEHSHRGASWRGVAGLVVLVTRYSSGVYDSARPGSTHRARHVGEGAARDLGEADQGERVRPDAGPARHGADTPRAEGGVSHPRHGHEANVRHVGRRHARGGSGAPPPR
ncbi:hypothetical protein D3C74_270310 [compost metagenome]